MPQFRSLQSKGGRSQFWFVEPLRTKLTEFKVSSIEPERMTLINYYSVALHTEIQTADLCAPE
jgi:hypothetical protein